MSRFYVGQRVRIVGCHPKNRMRRHVGKEGIIVRKLEYDDEGHAWVVDSAPTNDAGASFGWAEEHLAPAYDGHETVSWSECLWRPTPEKVA